MNDQKDLLEQFMHHNMPEKSIDPDEVFARTYQVLQMTMSHPKNSPET